MANDFANRRNGRVEVAVMIYAEEEEEEVEELQQTSLLSYLTANGMLGTANPLLTILLLDLLLILAIVICLHLIRLRIFIHI